MIWWLKNKDSYIFTSFWNTYLLFLIFGGKQICEQINIWKNSGNNAVTNCALRAAVCSNIGAKIFCHFHCFFSTFISSPIFPWMVCKYRSLTAHDLQVEFAHYNQNTLTITRYSTSDPNILQKKSPKKWNPNFRASRL